MKREVGKSFPKKFTKVIMMCMGVVFAYLMVSQTVYAKTVGTQTLYLLKGDKKQISLGKNINPKKYQWSSKNKKVASVNSKGKITTYKKGYTLITAKRGKKQYKIKVYVRDTVDLILFAGQSNMSGAGDTTLTPELIEGAGYEYKAVSAPKSLTVLKEPFGKKENSQNLNDGNFKTGSLVTAFVDSYYEQTKVPVVAISATKVGSGSYWWKSSLAPEAAKRYQKAVSYLKKRKIKIRHKYVVWFQGESDGLNNVSEEAYINNMNDIYNYFQKQNKIEKIFLIRTGRYYNPEDLENSIQVNPFDTIVKAQTNLCIHHEGFVLVSVKAASLNEWYYYSDGIHLTQYGLNVVGYEAGKNAGYYVCMKKQPGMYDEYLQLPLFN